MKPAPIPLVFRLTTPSLPALRLLVSWGYASSMRTRTAHRPASWRRLRIHRLFPSVSCRFPVGSALMNGRIKLSNCCKINEPGVPDFNSWHRLWRLCTVGTGVKTSSAPRAFNRCDVPLTHGIRHGQNVNL